MPESVIRVLNELVIVLCSRKLTLSIVSTLTPSVSSFPTSSVFPSTAAFFSFSSNVYRNMYESANGM